MGKCMLDIAKRALHEIILDKRCILFKKPHETVCPFYIIVDETTQKVCLPLQTLEFSDVHGSRQG